MTSDGSPYTRFKRALHTGNLNLVRLTAAELPHVGIDDALRVCLLLRESDPDVYDRAAVRWAGRCALEARNVRLDDVQAAAAALDALPHEPEHAMETLSRLCAEHPVTWPAMGRYRNWLALDQTPDTQLASMGKWPRTTS